MSRHRMLIALLAGCLPLIGAPTFGAAPSLPQVVVNGAVLNAREVDGLVQLYGQVYVGRYWYDTFSGLYGYEGKGALGQLHPGLTMRGSMSAAASGGGDGRLTGVFINGREIHPSERDFLVSLYGRVAPGRYWMDALGVGGFEYGPAIFNVARQMQVVSGGAQSGSHYMPWSGAQPGTHVGRAADGCVYISQGGYSNDFC